MYINRHPSHWEKVRVALAAAFTHTRDAFCNFYYLRHGLFDSIVQAAFERNWIECENVSKSFGFFGFVAIDFHTATLWKSRLRFFRKEQRSSYRWIVASQ